MLNRGKHKRSITQDYKQRKKIKKTYKSPDISQNKHDFGKLSPYFLSEDGTRTNNSSLSFLRNKKGIFDLKEIIESKTLGLKIPEENSFLPEMGDNSNTESYPNNSKIFSKQRERLAEYKEKAALSILKENCEDIQMELNSSYENRLKNKSESEKLMIETFK